MRTSSDTSPESDTRRQCLRAAKSARSCRRDLAFERAIRRRGPDATSQRGDESAGAAKREAADRLGHRHRRVETRCGFETMERGGIDVDPIENLLQGRPCRALAQTRTGV